jgi:anti-sigma B factor antagonist
MSWAEVTLAMDASGGDETPLRLAARHPVPGVLLVEISGELDYLTAPRVSEYLADQSFDRPAHLVLDLSGVTLLASHGMRMLVDALANRDGVHGALQLVGVVGNRHVQRMLDLVGLTKELRIHESLPELLRALPTAGTGQGPRG